MHNRISSPVQRSAAAASIAVLLLAALPGGAGAQEATTPQAAVVKVCTSCHAMQVVMDTPRDYDAWHDTVQKMIDRGAQGTQEEFGLVMDFLFQNMTTIDVNHADAEALMTVLHAPQAAADAIMARRASRPFKNLADLESAVPSLDKTVLEGKKRMIFFQ
ncbi:MAG TPA: hypothetical protein VH189_10455 [Rhizomicrobium sp.]|nr:hypothetical protein [Rhizomicrobium sp.]